MSSERDSDESGARSNHGGYSEEPLPVRGRGDFVTILARLDSISHRSGYTPAACQQACFHLYSKEPT
jgi:hypothetical protein